MPFSYSETQIPTTNCPVVFATPVIKPVLGLMDKAGAPGIGIELV